MPLTCRKAEAPDFPALQQMLELYQYELSDIWHQEPDAQARYGYDLSRYQQASRFFAHVALQGSQYVGFALVAPACVTLAEGSWMEQFFILKRHRRGGAGLELAKHAFFSHPGPWEVGQMPANVAAQAFWRQVIRTVTNGQFTEVQVTEALRLILRLAAQAPTRGGRLSSNVRPQKSPPHQGNEIRVR